METLVRGVVELFFTRAHEITHGFVLVRTFGLSYRTRWFGNRGGRGRWPQAARGCPGVYVTQIWYMNQPDRGNHFADSSAELESARVLGSGDAGHESREEHARRLGCSGDH